MNLIPEIFRLRSQYSYEANTGEYQAAITLVWNRNHLVDTTNVTLYKCEILGSHREHPDCSLCVTRNAKYECSWCGSKCSYSNSCLQTPVNECPKPRIDMVSGFFPLCIFMYITYVNLSECAAAKVCFACRVTRKQAV